VTNNRKKKGGTKFIQTTRKFQKVAVDIATLTSENKYLLIMIDYFIRAAKFTVIGNKNIETICGILRNWFGTMGQIEELITDAEK
jgi:hypothetical protein